MYTFELSWQTLKTKKNSAANYLDTVCFCFPKIYVDLGAKKSPPRLQVY